MPCEGFLLIDKPAGFTSYDVIRYLKKRLGKVKIGHAGTLDPFATGLLIIAVGKKYTTQLSHFVGLPKSYDFQMTFGLETDTLDPDGETLRSDDASAVTQVQLSACIPSFLGDQKQVPPQFSAKKKDGKRAYAYARDGEHVQLDAADITIHDLAVTAFQSGNQPVASLSVTCSKGTYVRSLARDLAIACDSIAITSALVRTAIGSYTLDQASALSDLSRDSIASLFHHERVHSH